MHNTRRIRATLLIKVSVGALPSAGGRTGQPGNCALGPRKEIKKSPVDPCTMLIVHIPPSWWQTVVEFTCLSLA